MLCALRRVLVASSLVLLAASASAQDTTLNNTWFKLKVKAKGEAAVPGEEKPHKASFSMTVYVHFFVAKPDAPPTEGDATYPDTTYGYEIWTETAPDTWAPTYDSTVDLETGDATVFYLPDFYMEALGLDGEFFESYQTATIKVKLDEKDALKSATFKTLGGEVYTGSTDGSDAFRGGVTMTGKTVSVDDLPFGLG